MSGNISWTPRGFEEGKKGFGSLVKRQENMHENLFTQNCRKASRMRIKVQVPSVWRADVYLADNYNPFKANKSTILLFQHEGSQAGLLLPDWLSGDERQKETSVPATVSGLAGHRSNLGSHQSLWTLYGLIWWLISMRGARRTRGLSGTNLPVPSAVGPQIKTSSF